MMMDKIRLGIIGIGNMGSSHARHVADGKCPDFVLTAVADTNPQRLDWARETFGDGVSRFDNAEAMLDSGLVDACIVSVPHYDHPGLAIACMERGIHQPHLPQDEGAGSLRQVWPDPPYKLADHQLVPFSGVL